MAARTSLAKERIKRIAPCLTAAPKRKIVPDGSMYDEPGSLRRLSRSENFPFKARENIVNFHIDDKGVRTSVIKRILKSWSDRYRPKQIMKKEEYKEPQKKGKPTPHREIPVVYLGEDTDNSTSKRNRKKSKEKNKCQGTSESKKKRRNRKSNEQNTHDEHSQCKTTCQQPVARPHTISTNLPQHAFILRYEY